MASGFVTNYGNSENSGLNWWEAKRTIIQGGGIDTTVYVNGFFNENTTSQLLIGYGNSIISYNGGFSNTSGQGIGGTNLKILSPNAIVVNRNLINCEANNVLTTGGGSTGTVLNSLLYNMTTPAANMSTPKNSTLIGNGIGSVFYYNPITLYANHYNIISNFLGTSALNGIQINMTQLLAKSIQYVFFHKSTFRFQMTSGGSNESLPSAPTGTTNQQKIDNLRARMVAVYGGVASDYLVGCEYSDDADTTIFIDPSRNNYYLVPNSLPSKMSYDGKYIGAKPEGSFLAFNSSNFTYSNFDSNGNVIDQKIDAIATGSTVDLGQIRTINKLDSLGSLAARNGNELNLNETILPNPLIYTDALTLKRTYKVYNAQITVGAKTYLVGECFIAKGTAFTSGADTFSVTGITSGTPLTDLACYQVEAGSSITYMGVAYTTGQRFQCYADSSAVFIGTGTVKKFDGGFVRLLSEYYGVTGITAGTALRDMQTYEVVGGTSVTYLSVVYTVGQRFTCIAASATAFTAVGGSTLSEWNIGYPKCLEIKGSKTDATLSTDVWVKMSLSDTPTVNYDANGKITYGNLDSGFVRANAQPLSVRYWKPRLTVQSLNIPL